MKMKKSKEKRIIALVLSMLLVFTLFTGCSGSSNQTSGSDTQSSSKVEESTAEVKESTTDSNEAEGPVMPELPNNTLSITVNAPNWGTDPMNTKMMSVWHEKMEEYLGITLDITWNHRPNYQEQEKVLIQAGDIGDVATYMQGSYINDFGADGMVLNIMDYWDYMTYYPEYVAQTHGGMEYTLTESGASYYFMNGYYNPENVTGAQSFTSFAYRFDILKEHNLTPATTLDEFTNLCADIQALIDSGDIDANYVMHNSSKDYTFYRGFVGIFHTWDTTYWNGSEWAFGPIEDNFREMLQYLNSLYEAGYIDPEFGTDTADLCNEKSINNGQVIVPTLWSGMAGVWNQQKTDENMEWGLAYLPEHPDYGTAWKWGSRQGNKSIANSTIGIIINTETEYPEWIVKMIDYQYSDEMVVTMNWGIEGESFHIDADGNRYFDEQFTEAEDQYSALAEYGLTAGGGSRPGIAPIPGMFDADTAGQSSEPWWSPADGYYTGRYWVESSRLGGPESISPYDRPAVTRLSESENTARAEMSTSCQLYAREQGLKFINGELDINDDAVWESYVAGVKSQAADFDGIFAVMNEKAIK